MVFHYRVEVQIEYSKEAGELLICVELMDASMERFYQTMHALSNITYKDLDHVLCRLTHNVIYTLV